MGPVNTAKFQQRMRNWLRWWLLATLCWWLILLPKHYALFDSFREPFQRLVYGALNDLFGPLLFAEDSKGMYLLLIVAPIVAIPVGFVPRLKTIFPGKVKPFFEQNASKSATSIMRWFLVLELVEYGWIKITKQQFYLPEPNTVYTEFGHLTKDIAWWSVMGSSPGYVLFMGVMELLAAALIVVRKTRFAGLLLAGGIFVQVVAVNFSFDISVKLFSMTLLGMTLLLLTGYPNTWRALFQLPTNTENRLEVPVSSLRSWIRALLLALIVTESLYPSVSTGNWNDDAQPRLAFHGAYAVTNESPLKRVYVHRHGYFIAENQQGEQYSLKILTMSERWVLLDEETGEKSSFRMVKKNGKYLANWQGKGFAYHLLLQPLPYSKLPLFQTSFHWFSDSFH